MAHSTSARKRIRQNAKHNARNRWRKAGMRTAIKGYLDKLAHGTPDEAAEALRTAVSVIDRTASKGVIHRNQADRRKSRLSAKLKVKQGAAKA
ncbi:MAG TPA: 30S ribosomal protein S20 [Phycisphaerales bacterium]|nr:30S ribosomal protein S20 [Phycisphaerales bacterium]